MARYPRVYSSRKYSRNPLFRGQRRREWFARLRGYSWRGKIVAVAALAAVSAAAWVLFYNPYFAIEEVVITGGSYIDEGPLYEQVAEQLNERRWWIFNQENIFVFSKKQVAARLQEHVSVDDLAIDRDLPRTLVISFTEKLPAAVWVEEGGAYYIDEEMAVLANVPGSGVLSGQLILKPESGQKHVVVRNGQRVVNLSPAYVQAAAELWNEFGTTPQEALAIEPSFTAVKREVTLIMHYRTGPRVYFNLDDDLQLQIEKLETLLAEKFNPEELAKLEYVDVRFGEKVYYK